MRWSVFAFFLLLLPPVQSSLAPRVEIAGAMPQVILLAVVLTALRARPGDAILAGWLLGLFCDFLSIERFGLFSLSHGLAAIVVVATREYVFRRRITAQLSMTFLMSMAVLSFWMGYRRWTYPVESSVAAEWVQGVLGSAVYTVLLVPAVAPMVRLLFRRAGEDAA